MSEREGEGEGERERERAGPNPCLLARVSPNALSVLARRTGLSFRQAAVWQACEFNSRKSDDGMEYTWITVFSAQRSAFTFSSSVAKRCG